jgi:hypothetical protein
MPVPCVALALNGASASGFTVAPLLVQLSQTIGLPFAVIECVLVGWAVLIPIILLGTRRESGASIAVPPRASNREGGGQSRALRDWHFWSVALPFALAIAAQVGFIVHMVAFLLPVLGPGRDQPRGHLVEPVGDGGPAGARDGDRSPATARHHRFCFLSQASGLGLLLACPGSVIAAYAGIVLFGLSVGNVNTLPAVTPPDWKPPPECPATTISAKSGKSLRTSPPVG